MNQIKHFVFPIALGFLLIAGASVTKAQEQPTTPQAIPVPVETGGSFDVMDDLARPVLLALVWTVLGITLFAVSIKIIVTLTPFSVQKEIEEDQNTALGIIIGSLIIGISIILSAAILG